MIQSWWLKTTTFGLRRETTLSSQAEMHGTSINTAQTFNSAFQTKVPTQTPPLWTLKVEYLLFLLEHLLLRCLECTICMPPSAYMLHVDFVSIRGNVCAHSTLLNCNKAQWGLPLEALRHTCTFIYALAFPAWVFSTASTPRFTKLSLWITIFS